MRERLRFRGIPAGDGLELTRQLEETHLASLEQRKCEEKRKGFDTGVVF